MAAARQGGPRRRAVVTTLLALAVSLTAVGSAQAAPKNMFGVMPQKPLTAADLERMGQANVGTLRFGIDWSGIDPSAAADDYQWGNIDALIGATARANIRVIPIIGATPNWVAKDLDSSNCKVPGSSTLDCARYAPQSNAAIAAWKVFVTDIAQRYGPGGDFWVQNPSIPEKPLGVYQIWNEQNSDHFYLPKPNVKKYAKMLKAAHDAVDTVDPTADIVLGGMFRSPGGGRKPSIFSEVFLDKLYNIAGIKRYFEGVAIHPYASSLKKVTEQVDLMHEVVVERRDTGVGTYITEIGWASSGPKNPLVKGSRGQAKRLEEAFDYFLKRKRALNLQAIVWYSWQDNFDTVGLCEWCAGSGLLTESGAEKPAFDTFVGYTGGS